ncbi:MAG: HPr family phosphocarrier protein [Candidatus Kapabacteria bacterium]|nr:HPr family phosphocarrier protein [Candidatus Kapabacteria bacterium]MCS7170380.1 HPr family phosphocarrier protein [Candidatus Kapabacteria bacterium]MDW7996149.1 HPr family phosphocarrier protein [Bacteroidota bacterium]MDW8224649.1 HPr family phosphocarrier protein [Bacteroidota bacterium]
MVEQRIVVRLPMGLHARPATELAALASRFRSDIQLVRDSVAVNAKSTLGLMSLAAEPGAELLVRAEGADAVEAVSQIAAFLQRTNEG